MIGHRLFRWRRFEVTLWSPTAEGWRLALGVGYEGHPREAQLTIDVLVCQLAVWWSR